MMLGVLRSFHEFEVFNAIIGLVAVDVMDV
jgi:hypothetical protein